MVTEEIGRVIRVKPTEHVPKRAPRILLTGPPGSGRSTQAEMLAEKYNLVHVTTMVKNEIGKKTKQGKQLWKAMKEGAPLPDQYIASIIEERINKLDCKINGFVMEGFPSSQK